MARPRSSYPPQTAAERQEKCRAVKRGEWHYCQEIPSDLPANCTNPNRALASPQKQTPALPAPQAPPPPGSAARALPAPTAALMGPPPRSSQPALPAPARSDVPNVAASTAIQKAGTSSSSGTSDASSDASKLALYDADGPGAAVRLSLPPAVAGRLRSLLERQEAGKSLTASERAEAEGLLDIAEYFVVQRLRRRLAA